MKKLTDRQLVFAWLSWLEFNKGRSAGTVTKYLAYLDGLTDWLKDREKTLRQADKADLEEFTGIEAHKRGMMPRSRRPLVAAVCGFYKWLVKNGYAVNNPAEKLSYPSAGERLPKGMTLHNAEKLLKQPDLDEFIGVRDAAILAVFMGCGLRLSGLVALNQSDLLFTEVDGKEWLIIKVIEKGDKERYIPAPHEARLLLRAYLGHHELKSVDRTLPNGDQVLFISTMSNHVPPHEYNGEARRMRTKSVYNLMTKYGEMAGLPANECHPHALRHLYGTEMTEDDIQQHKIQALMGHADISSTTKYQRVAMRSLMKAVDKASPLVKIKTPVTDLAHHLRQ